MTSRSASSVSASFRCAFPGSSRLSRSRLAIAAGFGVARLRVDDSLSQLFRSDTPEFRQYRGGDAEVSVERVRRSRRHRGRRAAAARFARQAARFRHRRCSSSMACRASSRLFSARQPPEGGHTPAPLFPGDLAGRRRLRRARQQGDVERDHPRQAALRGRQARPGRHRARSEDRRRQGARRRRRRNPQDDGGRSRRLRPQGRALRRSRHAARDPHTRSSATGSSTTPPASSPAASSPSCSSAASRS